MGEYFMWANPKKKEWIEADVFSEFGFMFGIASELGNRYTDAACTLMAGPWRGDPVLFIGDYFNPEKESPVGKLFGGYPYETVLDSFVDVSGLFSDSRGLMRAVYGDAPDSDEVPYDGLFELDVRHYRYAVNKTRGEYVDRDRAPVDSVCFYSGNYSWSRFDPIPWLLSPCDDPKDEWAGRWCCDGVDISDEAPEGGYEDVTAASCSQWSFVSASDEEMERLVASEAFARELVTRGITADPDGDIELHGAVDVILGLLPSLSCPRRF